VFSAAALLLLLLLDPRPWGRPAPDLAHLPAGLGLALLACQPRLGVLLMALTGPLLAGLVALRMGLGTGFAVGPILAVLLQQLALTGELFLAWTLYHRVCGGSRRLVDPRSAIFFLMVAVLVPAVFAPLDASIQTWVGGSEVPFSSLLAGWWLSSVLGLVLLGPPLLVLTPAWLLAPEEMRPESREDAEVLPYSDFEADTPTRGDWLEATYLALAAGLLGMILVMTGPQLETGWPLWGGTLLLTVWASLRQGLRGGTMTASAAALVPLSIVQERYSLAGLGQSHHEGMALLQASLLAQCAVALLVAASFNWIRFSEARYRQVVGHVPVVLYSARIISSADSGLRFPDSADNPQAATRTPQGSRIPRAEVTLVSAACAQLLGCRPASLLGDYQNWLRRVHPHDREVIQAALLQLTRQKQPVVCEYRLMPENEDVEKTPARGHRWLRDTLAPRFDSAGKLIGWEGVVTEITEQRVLADDLRRTTSMFHVLVTHLPAGVFFVQGSMGRPLLVNARARQLLGQREDSSAGLAHLSEVYRLFRPDGTPYPVEELPVYQALKYGRTTMRDDIVVHRPDGRCVPLVSWAAPLRLSEQGKEDAAVWVLEDLTAVHQAEAARRESEGRLRAIIETIGEGLIVLDRRGKVIDCNSAAGLVFQIDTERLIGKQFDELAEPLVGEDGTALTTECNPIAQVLWTSRPVRNIILGLVIPGQAKPGDAPRVSRWVLCNAMPRESAGELTGVVVTLADVTAARQAQEVLRLSEERYRGLIETLPLMLVQFDTGLRMDYFNPATEQTTGYKLDEVREPKDWHPLIHPDDLPRVLEACQHTLNGTTTRFELRYRTREGTDKVGFAMAQPRWHEGRVIGVTCLIVDLTRERHLERELQRSQRLELIGRLSSGVAHDFNNMLTVVLNLSTLSLEDLPADHPVQENLRRITEASEQASNLASQLLAFSRQQRISLRSVDLNHIVRRTCELVRTLLPDTITLTTDLVPEPILVRADETQLQQVLLNLCLNARDAMPLGGRVRISTRCVPCDGPGSCATLIVEDEGQGMSDEVRGNLFRPFFTTKERGHGLGLFVVQQIIESSGGHISVWSEPARGTRFEVVLPIEASMPQVVS
jgi:PAS domain S-box-containing protein